MLAWSCEIAERDIPQSLALLVLALVGVLPEYAIDLHFAWRAGVDPSYAAYATANMTGANLTNANLSGATLHRANLDSANLSGNGIDLTQL